MPAGDGTGPRGMGPMSGRAAGFCAGFRAPGYANPGPRGGFGMGRGGGAGGGGRGWRNRFYATGLPGWARADAGVAAPFAAAVAPEQELTALKQQAEYLDSASASLRQRLQELEAKLAGK